MEETEKRSNENTNVKDKTSKGRRRKEREGERKDNTNLTGTMHGKVDTPEGKIERRKMKRRKQQGMREK